MKKIENKQTSVKDNVDGTVKDLNYIDLLRIVMNVPPPQGYTISEMRDRLDIFARLDSKAESVELEDAHFAVVKNCVEGFRWGTLNKDIVLFVDYLTSL